MISKHKISEWILFAVISVAFCTLLSLRPIPRVDSANDTIRYVVALHQYCSNGVFNDFVSDEFSYKVFYFFTASACLIESDGFFLFKVAFLLPLMFLIFSIWNKATIFWATGLLVSVFGLELMTNAMRQALGMLFFFGALSLVKKNKIKAFVFGGIGVLAHVSILTFIPFLFWINGNSLSRKKLVILLSAISLVTLGISLFYKINTINIIQNIVDSGDSYSVIYSDELKTSFILFMVLPLYFIYFLRKLFEKENISLYEEKSIIYSTLLLVVCFIFFPYIIYRYAIFVFAMQIFLVSISPNQNPKIAAAALFGIICHLVLMLSVSNHFDVLFHG